MTAYLEREMKSAVRITALRKAILSSLATAGILSIAILAPNTLQLLGKRVTKGGRYNVKSAIRTLSEKGFVHFDTKTGRVSLTSSGQRYLEMAERRTPISPSAKRWDKKWRIVIFDIPEARARLRRHLAVTLRNIGLYRLQDSVWVFPHDTEELITLLKVDFRLGKEVIYIIADKIESDGAMRRHFGLIR